MRYAKIAIQSDGTGALDSTEAFTEPGPGLVRWFGGTDAGGLTWGDRPVNLGDLVLPLPSPGSGCRDIHQPLVDVFRRELGSGVPLDSLAGDDCPEAWEIDDGDGGVVRVDLELGSDGWTLDNEDSDDEAKGREAEAAALAYMDDRGGDYEEGDSESVYVAFDDEGDVIDAFSDEYVADDAVRARRDESRYGYPWAWGWAFYVDGHRIIEDLKAAGFVVATQTATGHVFCGIDGGGYDFASAHHVVFAALRLARYGGKVDVNGNACIPVGPVRS